MVARAGLGIRRVAAVIAGADTHAHKASPAGFRSDVRRGLGALVASRLLPSGLAGVAVLVCLCLSALVGAGPALAGTTNASTLTKTGTDASTGSTATATSTIGKTAPGDTINWVLSDTNTTGSSANVNLTDPIGANQTFVPGSLQTPPGLSPAWSTNAGGSFTSTEPGSGVNAIRAAGTSVDGSTGAQSLFSAPLSSFSAGASHGDGWEALLSDRTSGTSTTTRCRAQRATRSSTATSPQRAPSVRAIPRSGRRFRRQRGRRSGRQPRRRGSSHP